MTVPYRVVRMVSQKSAYFRVEEIANYALDNGRYVIINVHHNDGWEATTLTNEANARAILGTLWGQIARRFAKYDHHVIFEVMNEPRVTINGVDDWDGKPEHFQVVNHLGAAALDVIRAINGNNAKRLVMLPGYVAGVSDAQVNHYATQRQNDCRVFACVFAIQLRA